MNVTNLRAFWAVARTGSFQKAAKLLAVSQPTISREIKALEERYGVTLLSRAVRGCSMTKQGEKLYAHACEVFDILERAERELIADPIGAIRFHAVRHALTAEVIACFKSILPSVQIQVTINSSFAIARSLLDGECDLALLTIDTDNIPGIDCFEVSRGELLAYVPEGHPAGSLGDLTIETLAEFPLVTGSKEGQARKRIEELAEAKSLQLTVLQEIGPVEAIKAFAARAKAIGVFSDDGYRETRCPRTKPLAPAGNAIPVHLATRHDSLRTPPVSLIWRPLQQRFS